MNHYTLILCVVLGSIKPEQNKVSITSKFRPLENSHHLLLCPRKIINLANLALLNRVQNEAHHDIGLPWLDFRGPRAASRVRWANHRESRGHWIRQARQSWLRRTAAKRSFWFGKTVPNVTDSCGRGWCYPARAVSSSISHSKWRKKFSITQIPTVGTRWLELKLLRFSPWVPKAGKRKTPRSLCRRDFVNADWLRNLGGFWSG